MRALETDVSVTMAETSMGGDIFWIWPTTFADTVKVYTCKENSESDQ